MSLYLFALVSLFAGDLGWLDSIELPVPPCTEQPLEVESEKDFEDGKENIPLSGESVESTRSGFVVVEFFNVPRKFQVPVKHCIESDEFGVCEGISGSIIVPATSRVKAVAGIRVESMGSYSISGGIVHEGRAGNWSLFSKTLGDGRVRLGVFRSSIGVVPIFNDSECLELLESDLDPEEQEAGPVSAPVPGKVKLPASPVADCLVAYVRSGDPVSDAMVSACNSLKKEGYWVEVRYEHKSNYIPSVVPSYHLFCEGNSWVTGHGLNPGSPVEHIRKWLRNSVKSKPEVGRERPSYKS